MSGPDSIGRAAQDDFSSLLSRFCADYRAQYVNTAFQRTILARLQQYAISHSLASRARAHAMIEILTMKGFAKLPQSAIAPAARTSLGQRDA